MNQTYPPLYSRRRLLQVAVASAALSLLGACSRSSAASTSAAGPGETAKFEIGSKGEEMAFDRTRVAVAAGQTVELTFVNRSRSLRHNWILVDGGQEVAQVVYEAALAAGVDNDFQPLDQTQVLAHTQSLDPGEPETISFVAPAAPGEYVYLCTVPGHYLVGMKGVLAVQS